MPAARRELHAIAATAAATRITRVRAAAAAGRRKGGAGATVAGAVVLAGGANGQARGGGGRARARRGPSSRQGAPSVMPRRRRVFPHCRALKKKKGRAAGVRAGRHPPPPCRARRTAARACGRCTCRTDGGDTILCEGSRQAKISSHHHVVHASARPLTNSFLRYFLGLLVK